MDFDAWVRHVFDRPVTDPAWHWEEAAEEPPPEVAVEYLTRLFADPLPAVGRYTDAQLDQALTYLASNACSNYSHAVFGVEATWPDRRAALRAVGDLFERLFAVRCTPHLSHIDEPGASPLNGAAYMWWDVLPTGLAHYRPNQPHATDTDAEVLGVLRRTLALDSVACQEAALHGLGHWHLYYPAEVEAIIDAFLATTPGLRPELAHYAACARTGYVQ